MADQYRFKRTFEPILLPGETAMLFMAQGALNVRVEAISGLPEYIKDFGALTSGTNLSAQQDTNLELGTMEISQLRMRILDDYRLKLWNPSSFKQWSTAKVDFWLPRFPDEPDFLQEFFWQVSEFFVFEDDTPSFDITTLQTSVSSRVAFSGYKFKLVEIMTQGKVPIWVNSWPTAAAPARFATFTSGGR